MQQPAETEGRPTYQQVLESAGITLREIAEAIRAEARPADRGPSAKSGMRRATIQGRTVAAGTIPGQILARVRRGKEAGIRPPNDRTEPGTPENAHDLALRELGYNVLAAVHAARGGGRRDRAEALKADAMEVLTRLTGHELQEMLKRVALAEFQADGREKAARRAPDLSALEPELPPEAEYIGTKPDGTKVYLQCVSSDPAKRKAMLRLVADLVTDSHQARPAPGTH